MGRELVGSREEARSAMVEALKAVEDSKCPPLPLDAEVERRVRSPRR